jgi:nucleotide-binding universal stress UspA family protein
MAKQIVMGIDGSEPSWKAFDEAMRQATLYQCELNIVTVAEQPAVSPSAGEIIAATERGDREIRSLHLKCFQMAKMAGVRMNATILRGDSVRAVIDFIKEQNADLLIIGDKGHSSMWDALLGTNAQKFVREAPCSVLIVR